MSYKKEIEELKELLEKLEEKKPDRLPNGVVGHCPKCGLELRQVMGYVCSVPMCPTGLGGVYC